MPSLRDKIDYLTQIASKRPLTRADFQRSSEILYGVRTAFPSRESIRDKDISIKANPRQTLPPRFTRTEAEVIRELYQNGGVNYNDLKDWLGVAKSTVCHVIARKGAYKRNFATDY